MNRQLPVIYHFFCLAVCSSFAFGIASYAENKREQDTNKKKPIAVLAP